MANLEVALHKRINTFMAGTADTSTFHKLAANSSVKPIFEAGIAVVERQAKSDTVARTFDNSERGATKYNQVAKHQKNVPVSQRDERTFTLDEAQKGIEYIGTKTVEFLRDKRAEAVQKAGKLYFGVVKDTITYDTNIENQNGGFDPVNTAKTATIATETIDMAGTVDEIGEAFIDVVMSTKETLMNKEDDFDRGLSENDIVFYADYALKAPLTKYFKKSGDIDSSTIVRNGIESKIKLVDGTTIWFIKSVDFVSGAALVAMHRDSIYLQSANETVRTQLWGAGDITVYYQRQDFSMNMTPDRIIVVNKAVTKK